MGKTLIIKGANFLENAVDAGYKNLINPTEVQQGKYINQQGVIENADSGVEQYAVSGFIPVNGQNISCPTEQMDCPRLPRFASVKTLFELNFILPRHENLNSYEKSRQTENAF